MQWRAENRIDTILEQEMAIEREVIYSLTLDKLNRPGESRTHGVKWHFLTNCFFFRFFLNLFSYYDQNR